MKMGNEKKRSNIAQNNKHSSNIPSESNDRMMSVNQNNIPSVDLSEIKQENDIKQEPVPVGGLVEIPALTYCSITHVPGFNKRDGVCDFEILDLDEAKVEVKKECKDDKKEEEPKTNADFGEEVMDNQQNQQASPQDEHDSFQLENGNNAGSTKEWGGNARGYPSKPHKCDFCGYCTQYKHHLNRHLLKHTGEKPHACDFCPNRFTQKRYLRAHMKVHVEELLFHCSGCLQRFNGKDEKVAHEMNCKIRRYECHLCKRYFGSNKTDVIKHMRVHSGNKPFECNECFKQFTQQIHVNIHMKLHASPRSFRCSKCHQRFSLQGERNVHEEKCSRHAYECDICGKAFGLRKSNLIKHMRIHSGEKPFQCKECSKKFTQIGNLKVHMKVHTKKLQFECLICRQGFTKDSKRKAHQRNCNGRYYECHLCKKCFGSLKTHLQSHMWTHSGEKPFQCELCYNTFTLKGNLNVHMKNIHHKKY